MKEKRVAIGELKPGMEVWTPGSGWSRIVRLIRVIEVNNTQVFNWETTSTSRRLAGRRGVKIKTRG